MSRNNGSHVFDAVGVERFGGSFHGYSSVFLLPNLAEVASALLIIVLEDQRKLIDSKSLLQTSNAMFINFQHLDLNQISRKELQAP